VLNAAEEKLPCLSPLQTKGIIFNIQKFTVHDGPGIRTEIFLKGCNLRCTWCSNPESFESFCEVGVYSDRCRGISLCGKCLETCPQALEGALRICGDKVISIDRSICKRCLACEAVCPSSALTKWGEEMTVKEVMKVIREDQDYYKKSGGGVTFSGGECLRQPVFLRALLKQCRSENIHTCIESALNIKTRNLRDILNYTDMLITDIKHLNPVAHKQHTQTDNRLILTNIKYAVESGIPVVLRIPVIPGFNDSPEHMEQVSTFIIEELKNRIKQVQLLRFRRLGEEKYQSLGIPYGMEEVISERETSEKHIRTLVKAMNVRGVPAFAGTTNKIKN